MTTEKTEKQKAAERFAAERRADYVRALEDEKAGLKQRAAGATDEAVKARLDDRVKQVDAEIERVQGKPTGRRSGGQSNA